VILAIAENLTSYKTGGVGDGKKGMTFLVGLWLIRQVREILMFRRVAFFATWLVAAMVVSTPLRADLVLSPTFVNGASQVWNATTQGVVTQAINDWRQVLTGVNGNTQTINFTVSFSNAGTGGYLGQWQGGYSAFPGASVRPWSSGVNHVILFNADLLNPSLSNRLWFDPTPTTAGDLPFSDWDALSVARHEIGHMLGFTTLYVDNVFQANQSSPWSSRIVSNVFDPGGLNVAMNADQAHLGSTSGSLMSPLLFNGVRMGISNTEASMLSLAYGYNITAVPEPSSLLMTACLVIPIGWRMIRRKGIAKATE
jgi:hypothetical protein